VQARAAEDDVSRAPGTRPLDPQTNAAVRATDDDDDVACGSRDTKNADDTE
jgi:hypothetical protein